MATTSPFSLPDPVALQQQVQARAHEAGLNAPGQHVVSRVLLRRSTLPVPHNKQGLLKIDLVADPVSSEQNGPKGSGKVLDFAPFASASMEDFWGVIENRFNPAFAAIDDGSLFTRPGQLSVVRDMVALHYVRTMRAKQVHFKSFDEALANARDFWRQRPQDLFRFYQRQTGIVTKDPKAIERILDLLFKDTTDLVTSGAVLRERMENLYVKVRAILDVFNIEILTPDAGAGEFLIGDAPAVTVDPHSGYVGLAAGVGILGLDVSVSMPLGPGHMAWVHRGAGDGFHEIQADMVEKANAIQVLAVEANAFARPGTAFEVFADRVRKDQCYPSPVVPGSGA